jgi:hypothetical protein
MGGVMIVTINFVGGPQDGTATFDSSVQPTTLYELSAWMFYTTTQGIVGNATTGITPQSYAKRYVEGDNDYRTRSSTYVVTDRQEKDGQLFIKAEDTEQAARTLFSSPSKAICDQYGATRVTIEFLGGPMNGTVTFGFKPQMNVSRQDAVATCLFCLFHGTDQGTVGTARMAVTPGSYKKYFLDGDKNTKSETWKYMVTDRQEKDGEVFLKVKALD